MENVKKQNLGRLDYLDGARGIAAYIVLIYHILGISPWGGKPITHWLSIVFNGADAVSFFFVLSGLVLSYKYISHQPSTLALPLKQYVVARVFRLYPAYILTIVLFVYSANHGFNKDVLYKMFLNKEHFWDEALLIRGLNPYNAAGWTLAIELAVSLILPFLLLIILYKRTWFLAFLLLHLVLIKYHNAFIWHFGLGIFIAYYYHELCHIAERFPTVWRWRFLILLLAFFLFSLRHLEHLLPRLHWAMDWFSFLTLQNEFFFTAIASAVFIIYLMNSPFLQNILRFAPIHFLGKISYSVYLVQGLWAWHWLGDLRSFLEQNYTGQNHYLLFIAYVIIGSIGTVLCASVMYYTIEKPFMQYGKRLAAKL